MNCYTLHGLPCSEQDFIAFMRVSGLTEIYTQPVEQPEKYGTGIRVSKTLKIVNDRLVEV